MRRWGEKKTLRLFARCTTSSLPGSAVVLSPGWGWVYSFGIGTRRVFAGTSPNSGSAPGPKFAY